LQIIEGWYKAIKISKHGKIIEVYDTKRHIWSNGLAGFIIKEECHNANLKNGEFVNVRIYIIEELENLKNNFNSTVHYLLSK